MKIQTSYFSSAAPHARKVCIAKWAPFWRGARVSLFAPNNPKAKNWAELYRQDLENRFPTTEKLKCCLNQILLEVREPILCCYEKDPAECHRSILAEFIKERLGIEVTEWSESGQRSLIG